MTMTPTTFTTLTETGVWPDSPTGTTLRSDLYQKAAAIARYDRDFETFVKELASKLDIRYQNLCPEIQRQIKAMHRDVVQPRWDGPIR